MKFETYFWAPLATSIGIIISITLWVLNQRRKTLSYQILSSDKLVSLKGPSKHLLEVSFDGRTVYDARLLVIKIINNGHLPISPSDYQSRLAISVPDGAQIIFADVLETSPADLEERLRSGTTQNSLIELTSPTDLYLQPILLNSHDSATIQVLVNNLIGRIAIRAHINGVESIKELKRHNWLQLSLVQVGAIIMAGAALMVEPDDVTGFGLQELLPCILLFLLGYIVLSAGLYAPKRHKGESVFR